MKDPKEPGTFRGLALVGGEEPAGGNGQGCTGRYAAFVAVERACTEQPVGCVHHRRDWRYRLFYL